MKKIITLAAAVLALGFASCKKSASDTLKVGASVMIFFILFSPANLILIFNNNQIKLNVAVQSWTSLSNIQFYYCICND